MSAAASRRCFREPIPRFSEILPLLNEATDAHLRGDRPLAADLFNRCNDAELWNWTDSIWGKNSPHVVVTQGAGPSVLEKVAMRMPGAAAIRELHQRDGFHCRYCGLPVIRPEIRRNVVKAYPDVVPWGRSNKTQHAAFQAMWAQYDHVVPHSHGGSHELSNIVVCCAACNFGKMSYTLAELGLQDPRDFEPVQSDWDGLERFR